MQKTKSLQNIEDRMRSLEPGSFRHRTLEAARNFKNSWIQLGQTLSAVYAEKLFRDWGYLTFEAYCSKEIGVRPATAVKLVKSYYFLERNEPSYLKRQAGEEKPSRIPSVEAVNALRLAKTNKLIPESDYKGIRDEVLEEAREPEEVRKKILYVLKANQKLVAPSKEEQRKLLAKRLLGQLRPANAQMREIGFPAKVLKQTDALVESLEEIL